MFLNPAQSNELHLGSYIQRSPEFESKGFEGSFWLRLFANLPIACSLDVMNQSRYLAHPSINTKPIGDFRMF